MSEFTEEQIELETEKMIEGQIADHLETLGDRDYLIPHDVEAAYGSWLEVTHAARRWADPPTAAQVEAAAKAIYLAGDSTNGWHWENTAPQGKYRRLAEAALFAAHHVRLAGECVIEERDER